MGVDSKSWNMGLGRFRLVFLLQALGLEERPGPPKYPKYGLYNHYFGIWSIILGTFEVQVVY